MIKISQPLIIDQKTLIPDVTFTIEDKEHIALIGNNGIGKTTLLNQIIKEYDAALLEQSIQTNDSVLLYILSSRPELYSIKQRMKKDMEAISEYIEHDGYSIEQQIVTQLNKFGLTEAILERSIDTLSGGEQTKVGLTKLLFEQNNILIFDEPTNHIDYETKLWLMDWINQSNQTIIFASHDREFINQTATKIIELSLEGARTFNMDYDAYKIQKDLEAQTNEALVDKERKEKQKLKRQIQEFKEWHHAANAQAGVRDPKEQKKVAKIAKRFKQTEHKLTQRMADFQEKTLKQERTDYDLKSSHIDANILVRFEHVSFGYNTPLLTDINFIIKTGEKIRVHGKNGSGKSTVIKLINGELSPNEGTISINPNVNIGYFSQQLEVLNLKHTVLEEILSLETIPESEARTILASFRFKADRMNDHIAHLSMGEKCRLAFVKLYFSGANLLLLDEPTNYFDIEMQEIIERMLEQFNGTIIFVSHDDYFSKNISTKTFLLKDGNLIDSETVILNELDRQKLYDEFNDYLSLDYDPFEKR